LILADGPNRNLNPLWIISLFLSLTEATVGIAASQADGWVQGLWAIFSVVFPSVVGAVFFVFLWKKPFVFYAPRDFSLETPVGEYVEAMGYSGIRVLKAVEGTVRSAVDAALSTIISSGSGTVGRDTDQIRAAVDDIVATATEDFLSRAIEVDLSRISPKLRGEEPLRVFVDELTPVQYLTDQVYFAISRYVRPYRYGKDWVLRDSVSGRVFKDMGKIWAVEKGSRYEDDRPLGEIGIHPGMELAAVKIN